MKKIILIACVTFFSIGVMAQTTDAEKLSTTVFLLGQSGNDSDEMVKIQAVEYFKKTHEAGFFQVSMPRFMITDKKAKAIFAVGGFVNARVAYDFNSVMPNLDFVPYDIQMTNTALNAERFLMDASTSRLYFKTVIATKKGPLQAYIETDFRGTNYSLRLREAYISFMGFKVGQAVSTFTDNGATFNTIDFEGPNGYTYGRNLMVQYKHAWQNGISAAIAVEYPVVNATYGSNTSSIYQRVPDIPLYVQYAWGEGSSHIRASGILRNMYYYDKIADQAIDQIGWGAQLSGVFTLGSSVQLYGQALYGQGIASYIQDLQGTGMDMLPNTHNNAKLCVGSQMAWLVGAQINITPKMPLTLGYSQVAQFDNNGQFLANDYRVGQYTACNLFYNFSSLWNVGVEYLYGSRTNFDGAFNQSHRVQLAIQLNF